MSDQAKQADALLLVMFPGTKPGQHTETEVAAATQALAAAYQRGASDMRERCAEHVRFEGAPKSLVDSIRALPLGAKP